MSGEKPSGPTDLLEPMVGLGWDVHQLWLAAVVLGDVGTEDDVSEHLVTGNHLTNVQHLVLVAALHDGSLETSHDQPPR